MKDLETRKRIADKLSVLFPIKTEKERSQATKLLQELEYVPSTETVKRVDADDSFPEGYIGIYKPESVEGGIVYNRDVKFLDRWTYFSDAPTLVQKTDKKRVVFLGESVARGFLLEPEYTPVFALNKLLNGNSSQDKFDVVDMAESNISMRAIKNRFVQSLALRPDLVVFLAGNNWYIDYLEELANNAVVSEAIKDALTHTDDIGEIKPHLEKVMENLVIDFLTFVSEKTKALGITAIVAIPEFNLLDCRSTPGERAMTYLSGDKMSKWREARKHAEAAQKQRDLTQVAVHAQKMIEIDPSHPLGYELLADVKIEEQDYDTARELLEVGRDTALFCRSNSKPRTLQITRKTLLEHAPKLGIQILDIPSVFKAHLNGKIPGKDLFLDYCHFSVEGIQVAMEHLADQILALTGNQNKKVLQASTIKPSKQVVAMGYLFAAIHNEHWGQSYALHRHHCQKALEASKDVAKTMVYYCDMMSRSVSNNLAKSLEMIAVENPQVDRYGHAFMHPMDFKMMEIDLVDAMADALALRGMNLAKFVKELRKREHGVGTKSIDLLSPFYYATSYDALRGVRPAFFEAKDAESRFFVIADAGVSVDFAISYRVPAADGKGEVAFWFNDVKVASVNAGAAWMNHEFTVPGEYCKDGVNTLVVSWPVPKKVDRKTRAKIVNANPVLNTIHYVFGQISHFSASGVKEPVKQALAVAESATTAV